MEADPSWKKQSKDTKKQIVPLRDKMRLTTNFSWPLPRTEVEPLLRLQKDDDRRHVTPCECLFVADCEFIRLFNDDPYLQSYYHRLKSGNVNLETEIPADSLARKVIERGLLDRARFALTQKNEFIIKWERRDDMGPGYAQLFEKGASRVNKELNDVASVFRQFVGMNLFSEGFNDTLYQMEKMLKENPSFESTHV